MCNIAFPFVPSSVGVSPYALPKGEGVKVVTWFFGAFAKFPKAAVSFIMSVSFSICLPAWKNSDPTGPILMKFYIGVLLGNLSK